MFSVPSNDENVIAWKGFRIACHVTILRNVKLNLYTALMTSFYITASTEQHFILEELFGYCNEY